MGRLYVDLSKSDMTPTLSSLTISWSRATVDEKLRLQLDLALQYIYQETPLDHRPAVPSRIAPDALYDLPSASLREYLQNLTSSL